MSGPLLDARGLGKAFTTGRGATRRTVQAVAGRGPRHRGRARRTASWASRARASRRPGGSSCGSSNRTPARPPSAAKTSSPFKGPSCAGCAATSSSSTRIPSRRWTRATGHATSWPSRGRSTGLYDQAERRRRADELLARVGIDPSQGDRRPASFSGGQLQRIGIARALALEPSLIVCDEPVSALDVSVQGQILNLLMDLKHELGIAYLFIAHDLAVVRHISDRVSVMYAGRIVETGTRDQLFDAAGHPYTQALLAAMRTDRPTGAAAIPEPAADDAWPRPTCPSAVRSGRAARWPRPSALSSGRSWSIGARATPSPVTSRSRPGTDERCDLSGARAGRWR